MAGGLVLLAVLSLCATGNKSVFATRPESTPATSHPLNHPDDACAGCHADIYKKYEQTPMANGSGTASDGFLPGHLEHGNSGINYSVFQRGGKVWLSYERKAPPSSGFSSGALKGEQELQYFIGSGRRGRTYLFSQQELWFEAPINYYSKKQLWDMAPNYSAVRSLPLTMTIDSNCLHCHASEVAPSLGSVRNHYTDSPFKAAGIGCSSCHGDPASHLAAERNSHTPGKIVNPAKLNIMERDSICLQCHLEGDASVYKAGKSLADFKAGEVLTSYVTYFVDASRPGFGGRASSQYEALLRSACKRAAGDKLTCTSCHDPHDSPRPEERVNYFRGRCLACHSEPEMATKHHPEQQDCAVCHMPTRNAQDISHEQLTDHDIERKPGKQLVLGDMHRMGPDLKTIGGVPASERELGLAYALLARNGDHIAGVKALNLLLKEEKGGISDVDVHVQLGFLQQINRDPVAAEKEYKEALTLDNDNETALGNLAVLEASSGRSTDAANLLNRLVNINPAQTTAGMNLAFIYCRSGEMQKATQTIATIKRFNPDNEALRKFVDTGDYGGQSCRLRPQP